MIDLASCEKDKGDKRFRRFEYWGLGPFYLLHYTGDHTVYEGFQHRNSTKPGKPFIRSAPHVKRMVSVLVILYKMSRKHCR